MTDITCSLDNGHCLQEKCRTCYEVLDHGYMGYMNKNFGYAFTHHVDVHMKDDAMEQHPGHRGFSTYVRNKLLNAASFGNPTDHGGGYNRGLEYNWLRPQLANRPQFCGYSTDSLYMSQGTVLRCGLTTSPMPPSATGLEPLATYRCVETKGATTTVKLSIRIYLYLYQYICTY